MTGFRRLIAVLLAACGLVPSTAAAQNATNGGQIYNSICITCHGMPPVGGPEKAANNPSVIAAAINNVASMRFLQGVYTSGQLADIAAFIATVIAAPPPPPPPATPTRNYTDLWWNANESGWGFNIIQHAGSNNIFGVIYTYEAPNRPLWLVMPGGGWISSTTFTGPIYRVTGPSFDQPFDPGKVVARQVGGATISFTSASTGTLTYVVDGVTTTKSITRQPF